MYTYTLHVRCCPQDALLPFQTEGVRFAAACEGRVLIGDEMGLGKTLQARPSNPIGPRIQFDYCQREDPAGTPLEPNWT